MVNFEFSKPDYEELKKDYDLVDMHTHTQISHDASTTIKEYSSKLKRLGIGSAVTDHNQAQGFFELKKINKKSLIIPGIEVTSIENKDVLLYFNKAEELKEFYDKHIKPKITKRRTKASIQKTDISAEEILEKADDYNAFKVFPHPLMRVKGTYNYMKRRSDFSMVKKIDGIEIINSGLSSKKNAKAVLFCEEFKKAYTGGSDSHVLSTLGNTVTAGHGETSEEFLENIRKKQNKVIGLPNTFTQEFQTFRKFIKGKMKFTEKHS